MGFNYILEHEWCLFRDFGLALNAFYVSIGNKRIFAVASRTRVDHEEVFLYQHNYSQSQMGYF